MAQYLLANHFNDRNNNNNCNNNTNGNNKNYNMNKNSNNNNLIINQQGKKDDVAALGYANF